VLGGGSVFLGRARILSLALISCYPHHDEVPMLAEPPPVVIASPQAPKPADTSQAAESATESTGYDAGSSSQRAFDGVTRPGANGWLPPEIIQRVVRNSFGSFRRCYETALRHNHNLQGRVTVKFVIDRSGAVAMTADAGSDLPDQGVVRCVVRGFGDLSFPPPDGGMVTVVYPIIFRPAM
jgi:hypothetical protein